MTFFASSDYEKGVIKELQDWTHLGLNVPNEYFNGLPACPFARQAWLDEKVAVIFDDTHSWQCLYSTVSQFDDAYDIAVIVRRTPLGTPEDLHNYLGQMNEVISQGMFIDKDIWLMGYHPDDEEAEFVAEDVEVEEMVEEPYLMVFVQRLSKIQEAAYKLVHKGYYENYMSDEYFSEQYAKREEYYLKLRRNEHANEEEKAGQERWRRSNEKTEASPDEGRWRSKEKNARQKKRGRSHGKTKTGPDARGWFTQTNEKRWGRRNVAQTA